MAQADYVNNAIRVPITGADAKSSTSHVTGTRCRTA